MSKIAELATLPRVVAGLKARSNVNAKYQQLRFGAPRDVSMDWLQAQREANQEPATLTDNQRELMAAYKRAVAPWRGVGWGNKG